MRLASRAAAPGWTCSQFAGNDAVADAILAGLKSLLADDTPPANVETTAMCEPPIRPASAEWPLRMLTGIARALVIHLAGVDYVGQQTE